MTGLVTRPDVSIITVNWNTGEMTARAVKSIYDHARGVTFELIAVDNGSTRDDSATTLPSRFPSIHVHCQPEKRRVQRGE